MTGPDTTTEEPLRLTVAVPTFHRPASVPVTVRAVLSRVREVLAQEPEGTRVRLLVVDNDVAGSGVRALTAAGLGPAQVDGVDVRVVVEPAPGLAAVRNRVLDECREEDLLVFVDDDEVPAPGWLAALVRTWRGTGAAAVAGHVVPRYAEPPGEWIEAGGFFRRRSFPTGTCRPAAGGGNLLLDLRVLRRLGLRFDEDFGATGGEDTLLTRTLVAAGGSVVWCAEAVCEDVVPPERLSRSWVLQRARSHATTSVRVDLVLAGRPPGAPGGSGWPGHGARGLRVRAQALAGGAVRALVGAARAGRGRLTGSVTDQARGARLRERGIGLVSGSLGAHGHRAYGDGKDGSPARTSTRTSTRTRRRPGP